MNSRVLTYSTAIALSAIALLSTTIVTADESVDEWSISPDRSSITFHSSAPAESFSGTSEDISGTVRWNRDSPRYSTAEISFPVESMRTGNRTRDRHLANDDWLNADEHPEVRFTLEGLDDLRVARPEGQIHYRATARGTVDLHGVEKETEATVEIAVLGQDKIARIQPSLEFALADHNIEGAGGDRAIGTAVGEVIEVEGTIYASWD